MNFRKVGEHMALSGACINFSKGRTTLGIIVTKIQPTRHSSINFGKVGSKVVHGLVHIQFFKGWTT